MRGQPAHMQACSHWSVVSILACTSTAVCVSIVAWVLGVQPPGGCKRLHTYRPEGAGSCDVMSTPPTCWPKRKLLSLRSGQLA